MAANDDTDQMIADDIEQAIIQSLGEELRRARTSAGWSRSELIQRMKKRVPVNTYACYEQGIRSVSIPRLVEICHALGVGTSELLSLALQRLDLELETSGVRIDLHKIIQDERVELRSLRQWARNKLEEDATTTNSNEPVVVRLPWVVVKEWAVFCGLPKGQLLSYIREFAPESALRL